ncbi:MAG: ABC transporter ATP-binding protein [Syntrophus sp. (in: bacteria)]|nr:ABC transporter ATP-binding protein [Syntrophus sp. (in: bacteria)]
MSIDIVSAENLHFQYNATEVLTDLSFSLKKGDYLGLVGPNGSGKTTLIRLILGFFTPTRGTLTLFGQTPSRFSDWHRVGYLPQRIVDFNPHFPATVKEVVALGLLSRKQFPKRIGRSDNRYIDQALDLVDIGNIRNKLIGELSGGQQQRVFLAKAMVGEPDILILDEPTTALDPDTRERFFNTLKALNRDKGVTIIMITHDTGTIGKYASKMLYLDKRIIFYGTFEDFCMSQGMATYFGEFSQHLICHRHDGETGSGRI